MDKYLKDFSEQLEFNIPSAKRTTPSVWNIKPGDGERPSENFTHRPSLSWKAEDISIKPENLTSFYVDPGEFGYFLNGIDFGFKSLSFVLTNTQPQGGPPLHHHSTEEAHVVLEGEVTYYLDGNIFKRRGPYVLRIPANIPHTFINSGKHPFHLIAVFPAKQLDITELGVNPLVVV